MGPVTKLNVVWWAALASLLAGCQTSPDEERGPDKTVAQYVKVESSVPGITIQTNGAYAGKTPLILKIFGDAAGTFHNFGSPQYILRALPLTTNQVTQTKIFRAGTRSVPGDSIPGLIFFDMSHSGGSLQIDSFPEK